MKLITNAVAKGYYEENGSLSNYIYIYYIDKEAKNKTINTDLPLEYYPDFDHNQDHKVYVDDDDRILIKCIADMIDTPFKLTDITKLNFLPEYDYDDYA